MSRGCCQCGIRVERSYATVNAWDRDFPPPGWPLWVDGAWWSPMSFPMTFCGEDRFHIVIPGNDRPLFRCRGSFVHAEAEPIAEIGSF